MQLNYQDKKVLVIGLGLSGQSASKFLLQKKAFVIGVDRHIDQIGLQEEMRNLVDLGMQMESDQSPVDFTNIDLVVLSPGVPMKHPLVEQAIRMNIEVIGEIELGCRNSHSHFFGITGTNGKTTVTLLVNHVLESVGFSSKPLGNVGAPLTQAIYQQHLEAVDTVVLELSSYQLETMQQKVLDAALLLNITPDHLDRYQTMAEYAKAKIRIANCLKQKKTLFVEYKTWQSFQQVLQNCLVETYGYTKDSTIYSDLRSVYFHGEKMFELPLDLQGRKTHELENLMGAYALCTTKHISGTQFIEAFQSFQKPPHRIQWVRNFQGVSYYDDSKGTNIDAVISAVNSLNGEIILIAGGVDKGSSYQPWIEVFRDKVRKILVIGQASKKIKEELGNQMSVEMMKSLKQAVLRASELAREGEFVLLSPGCASQDMFKDYAHRGEIFQQLVRSLGHKGE